VKRRLIVTLALLAFVLVFALQNAEIVDIQLLFWTITMPRSLLIFAMLAIGVIVGWFSRSLIKESEGTDTR
jgi:putative membrane protein